jgi:hypothetical protein
MRRGLHQDDPFSSFLFFIVTEEQNVMLNSLVDMGLLSGYDIKVLKAHLISFKLIISLKVNVYMSLLIGVSSIFKIHKRTIHGDGVRYLSLKS